jgi:hypothetical protein
MLNSNVSKGKILSKNEIEFKKLATCGAELKKTILSRSRKIVPDSTENRVHLTVKLKIDNESRDYFFTV